jgi:hypothetical protein
MPRTTALTKKGKRAACSISAGLNWLASVGNTAATAGPRHLGHVDASVPCVAGA